MSLKILKKQNDIVTVLDEEDGLTKTMHYNVFKIFNRSKMPKFVGPYSDLVTQVYNKELPPMEFLEEFLREYTVRNASD